jgi:ATP:ADP antiporter, AAA family
VCEHGALKKRVNDLLSRALAVAVKADHNEIPALFWSFAYHFCLLCAYYILRPLRDEMGITGGVSNLQWMFTGTFIVMLAAVPLFGYFSARLPRHRLFPVVYGFFIVNILIFFIFFQFTVWHVYVARAFFIWTSVFNLFVISVFWSFMADLFTNVQARRVFGFIAAGGSAGAIVGPLITGLLARPFGPVNLLLISMVMLGLALVCIHQLVRWANGVNSTSVASTATSVIPTSDQGVTSPLGGGIFSGVKLVFTSPYLMGICLFFWLYTTLATFLYFTQAQVVADAFDDPARRTALFAWIDFAVNVLTVAIQVMLTGRLMLWLGVPFTLALIPALLSAGFLVLGMVPGLPVLVVIQVIRRAGNYGITRPAREVLYTVIGREAKYKAKNFIDTVVYRGGDAISGWVFTGLKALGLSLSGIAWVAVPMAVLWLATAWLLGKRQEILSQTRQ